MAGTSGHEGKDGGAGRLGPLWYGAIAAGLAAAAVTALLFGLPGDFDGFAALLSMTIGAAVFGGVFFIGANLMGVRLERRVRDETRISGANVDHVTHVEETGDAATDRWLARYVFARNVFGGLLVPLAILAGLVLFAG